jgi:FAD/FMN-containing dehydrogenase
MVRLSRFVNVLQNEFPSERLTWQNSVPTFHPESTQEAAKLFRLASEHGRKMYIAGFANNITPVGRPFERMITVSTDRLNQIIEISDKDLFVRVGAGYPLREINYRLKPYELFVPHSDLPYVGSAGGAVATGLSAELNGHELPLKKFLLKAEIVTPEGDVITPGSVCFKSASGYDVVKVFAGSWGLLGLIVNLWLRTVPESARDEYQGMRQEGVSREGLIKALSEDNTCTDAVYCRKIKQKFDPEGVLPIV